MDPAQWTFSLTTKGIGLVKNSAGKIFASIKDGKFTCQVLKDGASTTLEEDVKNVILETKDQGKLVAKTEKGNFEVEESEVSEVNNSDTPDGAGQQTITNGGKTGNESGAEGNVAKAGDEIAPMIFRNVDEFAATFDAEKKLSSSIRGEAWNYFNQGKWKELEELFDLNKINGGRPPNGFIRYNENSMRIGTTFDSYGGYIDDADGLFKDKGNFASPLGASFESRALPASNINKPYMKYKVIKEIPNVKTGEAIPWYNQIGKGIQYEFPESVDDLIKGGYIEKINF